MKFALLFFAVLGCLATNAQVQVHTVSITTNDIVYDAVTDRIYASIPSANGANGNSIGIINPHTYTLENTVFMGSEPSVLAISDDGQYIYTGFTGTSTVRRFNIAAQTAELQFPLGTDPSTGPYYVEDIEVVPGQPHAVAISRRNSGFSPAHEGVAIYDDGVMRPNTTQDHTGSNRIEFKNTTTAFGYNNETTEFGLRRLTINAGGISEVNVVNSMPSSLYFFLDFIYHDNKIYYTEGSVVDITTAPFLSGQFPNAGGPVAYDTQNDLVCYASSDFAGNLIFQRFNPNTFLLHDNLPIFEAFGFAKSLITCGNNCYAFNTSDNNVVIINDEIGASGDEQKDNALSIYPNPAIDNLNIAVNSETVIREVQIFTANAKLVYSAHSIANPISINSWPAGMYIVKLQDERGRIHVERIVKK